MINRAELKNFGPIKKLDWQNLGKINLIIGNNDCGKSFLLKAIYSAMKTIEEYKRGDNPDEIEQILKQKLYWIFQSEKIGYLVNNLDTDTKRSIEDKKLLKNCGHIINIEDYEEPPIDIDLQFSLTFDEKKFSYSFNYSSSDIDFHYLDNKIPPRQDNSIFIPTKEILSTYQLIFKSLEQDKLFGFDGTYLDLARMIRQGASMPSNANSFKELRKHIEQLIGGKIEFNEGNNRWYFKKNDQLFSIFSMGVTAEGIKKLGVLEPLLASGYVNENSIIFIDEPESTLHPEMITKFLDIISLLAKQGMQIFIASHSYFVIKKLFLIAQEQEMSIPVLSYQNNEWVQSDLKDDLPDNPIIDESIKLYEQQLDLSDI